MYQTISRRTFSRQVDKKFVEKSPVSRNSPFTAKCILNADDAIIIITGNDNL